ncbi:hypothetical protein D0869_15507 [Hortaea werneckii]|uniref:Uncharacterized protein n=1 Tax=Hortaea werneckii TaxID=91943 RepID=A0A3M6VZ69_HORWE|nr:hypothetical protein KC324_g17688 [Hortaea werneckii]KAI7544063.1 hypothetical protein KC316_g15072 [Hortaea werneckii]RMX71564.1 hypothetical protein D0869_15507 [Hortaea werneckii]RMY10139.1 hypothetical protein D0868_03872 [Hortaea werneckii]
MFALRTRTFAAAPAAYRATATTRTFGTSRALAASKESALHQEGRAEEAEREKQEQLKEQREGKGHWKDELASDSESIVKADRNDMKNTQATISELQKEAAKQAEKEKKEGKQ